MRTLVIVAMLVAGCSLLPEAQQPDELPRLVTRTPLPVVPPEWSRGQPRLEALFHVSRTGEVMQVRFLTSTGYDAWESDALNEMKQWRFSPARFGADSVAVWIRVPMSLRFLEPRTLLLAQFVCSDQNSADSAYQMLLAGLDADVIVRELSAGQATVRVNEGETDIRLFSETVQKELGRLKENQFTRPMKLGNSFVVFKRLSKLRGSSAHPMNEDVS
ncbi:MAG TPA: energy transducer TonB [Bacteroidota bacterium]